MKKEAMKAQNESSDKREDQTIKKAPLDLVQTLRGLRRCSQFIGLVEDSGFLKELSGMGPFTVFAPLNENLENLPVNLMQFLKRDKHRLRWFVGTHIVADKIRQEDIVDMQVVKTLSGEILDATAEGSHVLLDGVKIVEYDIRCTNGMIHVLGGTLWPK
jgi:uncharacterized surface protein with fasciclin (FAS1) repeats